MKKNVLIVSFFAVLLLSVITVTGCGKSVDRSYLDDMSAGLEARWAIVDSSKDADDETVWTNCINAEYDKINKYKNEIFEDKDLGKLAKEYIALVKESKDSLKYYDNTSKFTTKNNEISYQRAEIIYKLNKDDKLTIDDKYKNDLSEMADSGKTYEAVQVILNNTKFKMTNNEYGWKDYAATVKNTTEDNFDYFNFNINLVDKKGVVVDTEVASTNNWDKGAKHKFEFSTDKTFKKIEIKSCDWDY